jgi:hypothetical protein
MSLFIPKKIKVGYQNRPDTYSGKLAYVIYYDAQGKLRKEGSWNSWRDKEIPFDDFDNEPTEGFVLNKKVGGYQYHYDMRQTYTRVFDPRGFEIEISIPNLLHILENTDCIKGKGLMGEFVYAWDGTELVLLPTASPDYADLCKKTEVLLEDNYIIGKDLQIGRTYSTIDGKKYVFMGKYPKYSTTDEVSYYFPYIDNYDETKVYNKKSKPVFWFMNLTTNYIETMSSITRKFYSCVDENVHIDFQTFQNSLENDPEYCPPDWSRKDVTNHTLESFREYITRCHYTRVVTFLEKGTLQTICFYTWGKKNDNGEVLYEQTNSWNYRNYSFNHPWYKKEATVEEIFNYFKPVYITMYLENGNVYRKEFN